MKILLFITVLGLGLCGCSSPHKPISIVPYPAEMTVGNGTFAITGIPVTCDTQTDPQTQDLAREFARQLSICSGAESSFAVAAAASSPEIHFAVDQTLAAEGYRIEISKQHTRISASTFAGFFYAMQSLKQLLPVAIYTATPASQLDWTLPCLDINDAPRFAYRGMHLDVARHFFSIEEVKRYLDIMAIHKLNTFHWHLTDDQGWRIEIKRYPRLTSVGSIRNATVVRKDWDRYDGTPYGGFYTQDEIREVVAYAAARSITVIPEIDLPGHMLAALTAYPELGCTGGPYAVWGRWGVADDVLCPGKEPVFDFLEGVLTEVLELFPSQYIHIGGDECPKVRWETCPHCQARIRQLGLKDDDKHTAEHYLQSYVTKRIEQFLNARGRRIIGWDEILEGEVAPSATIMSWRGSEGGIVAAKMGHDAIMTPTTHFYFDYYQSLDKEAEPFGIGGYLPMEQVYSYDPTPSSELTAEQQKHILGVQANLWTEYISDNDHLEYMLLPRLAALSEVQWCQPEVRDWNRFITNFKMADIYTALGYNFAKHIYGVTGAAVAVPEKGCVEVTLTTQGDAPIYYTLDGTTPSKSNGARYTAPVAVDKSCTLQAVAVRDEMQTPVYSKTFEFSKSTCRPVTLNTAPTMKYTYGGALALIDGFRGGLGYTNGSYVGFLKEPLDITLDMKEAGAYSSVTVYSLADMGEWVFPPAQLEIAVSDDGKVFTELAKTAFPEQTAQSTNGVKALGITFPETESRYLRVIARPAIVPSWHGAAGEPSHLFISEVTVE